MRALLKLLGVTYFVSPSDILVIHVRRGELGTSVKTIKLYNSRIKRIFAKLIK